MQPDLSDSKTFAVCGLSGLLAYGSPDGSTVVLARCLCHKSGVLSRRIKFGSFLIPWNELNKPLKSVTRGQCDAKPRLLSQLQGIIAPWPVCIWYEAFLHRSKRCGYCSPDLPSFVQLVEEEDERLFRRINNNSTHVLRGLRAPVDGDTAVGGPTACGVVHMTDKCPLCPITQDTWPIKTS